MANKEQESGSTPSPARQASTKKVVGPRSNGSANGSSNRRLSLNTNQNGRSVNRDGKRDARLVAVVSKEDAASDASGAEPLPTTP